MAAPPKCNFCGELATEMDMCMDCYAERVAIVFDPQELLIEFPVENIHEDLKHALWTQLKAKPTDLVFKLRPFTFANLKVYRTFLLQKYPGVIFPLPLHTRGQRGASKQEWKLTLEETTSFMAIVGDTFLPNNVNTFGTGRRFTPDAFTMWVPPLEFTLTSSDPEGIRNSCCTVRTRSLRLTEHGFSSTARMKAVHLPTAKRYAAISAFGLQQEIQLQNAQMGEGGTLIEMLPQQRMALALPIAAAPP